MTDQLRRGLSKIKEMTLAGEVECDEAYVIAGHKDNQMPCKRGDWRRRRLKAKAGREHSQEKPPILA